MNSLNNYKYCKFNANRHAHEVALPFCTWRTEHHIDMPPHIYWNGSNKVEEENCAKCKCFIADKLER